MRYSLLIITYRGLSLSLENDVCMRMFFHSLEGRAFAEFFSCPPKILSTWAELAYWFATINEIRLQYSV
uniref:Uncharacterized protein n=1 Tax=Picea glauca TaxID=3330 RepID=A0A101M0N5_PICGL|nr:hypothetical protein ABT39_MTgene1725 [Picea glauca]KUM48735.1 hypothetical protein ABT39_MTgene4750 [Picea glauca]QHR89613.1 hypothetical protein Q903MT_gene3635 [Picea sitchensis]